MKLIIAGAQELTRNNVPWDAKAEIWAISNHAAAEWCKRIDAVIEVHRPEVYKAHPQDPAYWEWLQKTDKVVYMLDMHPSIKNAQLYPLDKIKLMTSGIQVHGASVKNLGSSVDYALALAIFLNYKEIDFYGVEMAHSSEYKSQQASFTFWTGFAAGRGIKLNFHCTKRLFDRPLYGQEEDVMKSLYDYQSGLRMQKIEHSNSGEQLNGALQIISQMIEEI